MGFRSGFLLRLLGWVVLLIVTGGVLAGAIATEGLGAARIVAAFACALAIAGLWNHVRRTNLELARFVDSIRFGDLSQNFTTTNQGSGFGEIGQALDSAIRKLRDERHTLAETNRFYEAVLDDAPTALLVIDSDGRVELGNKAARRLLVRHRGVRVDDFREYGEAFASSLGDTSVGRPRLVPLIVDGVPQTAMISAAIVHRLGGLVRVVAVQPIQSELNAVEIAAQSDLIRVLTHEIMNSMTPVTSLAHTAAELVAKADGKGDPDVADARSAIETVARRADGVMQFVQTYRQISRSPKINPREFQVAPWADELASLFRASDVASNVELAVSAEPSTLSIDADADLLFQVLMNLLRNGAEAAAGHADKPRVSLTFSGTRAGRTRIEIADNGPGVPQALRQDVFLPFFTTKQKGTGVGLSLARQIVLAHRGSIALESSPGGGALFRILI